MPSVTLLSLTGVAGVGPITPFSGTDNIRVYQVNPRPGVPFSGSLEIQESYAASPGNNDFQTVSSITFTAHPTNFSLEVESDAPWVRINLVSASSGEIAVFGASRSGSLAGGGGSPQSTATAIVNTSKKAAVTPQNSGVHISLPVVPLISSDDVAYALDINKTVTDVLSELDVKTNYTATAADIELLAGLSTVTPCGSALTTADFCKLTTVASVSELNFLIGVTSDIQPQLDALASGKADGAGVDITGLVVDPLWMNSFFDVDPAGLTVSSIATNLSGLTATAADLNVLSGTVGTFTAADLAKLGSVISSAAELNSLSGFTGSSTDLNKLSGLISSTADLNAISGLAGTGVSTTELTHLSGLTENVQAALNAVPALAGLTATTADLNLLLGAATGTGAYAGAITSTEISYLDGLASNIQSQLNTKRDISVPIGISEISGASITTVELNYSQGLTGNIQAQIDSVTLGAITTAGGTFTGPIYIADGSAANPGLGYASANTTGLYLQGAPGMGFSVNGTRAMSLDATDLAVGDGLTNGQPNVKHSGIGEANPAYSFVGGLTSGLYWAGVDSIGLSAGGAEMLVADATAGDLKLGGAAAANNTVTVSGVAGFEKVLGKVSLQAGSGSGATGNTSLYVVPAGRTAVITKVLMILTNVTGFIDMTNFRMNIGITAPTFDELVDNINNVGVYNPVAPLVYDTPNQVLPLGLGDNVFTAVGGSNGNDYQALQAADDLRANISVLANATDYDFDLVVFGYEF